MLIPDPHGFRRIAKNRMLSLHKGRTTPSRKSNAMLSVHKKLKNGKTVYFSDTEKYKKHLKTEHFL
jgi:hypothetical protein